MILDTLACEAERPCMGWADFGATCPPSRDCATQGCAVNAYANAAIKRDQALGYPENTNGPDDREFEQNARGRQKWRKDFIA